MIKGSFYNLLKITRFESFFMLGRRSYEQCDGVAMSSLLGPALANVFMCHFENVCLENCQTPNFKLTAYRRFLDYTILLF